MNGMSDQYYSRLLALAKQNKGIKFIKNIKDDLIEVELDNGISEWMNFNDVIGVKEDIVKNEKTG